MEMYRLPAVRAGVRGTVTGWKLDTGRITPPVLATAIFTGEGPVMQSRRCGVGRGFRMQGSMLGAPSDPRTTEKPKSMT